MTSEGGRRGSCALVDRTHALTAQHVGLPYAGATDRVALFGYPLDERHLNGIWVQATPAGLTAAGVLQIDATGAT
jgi:hypothetical protein